MIGESSVFKDFWIVLSSRTMTNMDFMDRLYISKERAIERPKGILEIPPNLIIEIISEGNTAWEITDKGALAKVSNVHPPQPRQGRDVYLSLDGSLSKIN